ncbi:WhiB family transcriptional regulator [Pseudonocardia sp. GCM10023141]|uniref:WhiB family transcriptional regulator n=1 Tax=Pseudonocardia sp. GCM10023141 TaxID=3252653 RepID=UPI0036192B5D
MCGSRGVRFPSATRLAVGTSGPALVQIAEAKAVCARCPVTAECLGWALASGQDSGVWGGLTDAERRDLRARRAASGRQRAAAGSRRTRPCSGPYER